METAPRAWKLGGRWNVPGLKVAANKCLSEGVQINLAEAKTLIDDAHRLGLGNIMRSIEIACLKEVR